jgi:hypothetical protein
MLFIHVLIHEINLKDKMFLLLNDNFYKTRRQRHKFFEYSQGNSQVKYLSQIMVKFRIFPTLITFSDLSMYRLGNF